MVQSEFGNRDNLADLCLIITAGSAVAMHKNNAIALAFFVTGSIVVWLLDNVAERNAMDELRLATRITAEQLHLRLETCVAPRLALIELLSEDRISWSELENSWQNVASTTYGVLPGIQALNLLNANRIITQIYPSDGNEEALGANLNDHSSPAVVATISQAESTNSLQRTPAIELLQSGTGIAIYKPIRDTKSNLIGFVNGVFRVHELLNTCFSEQNLYDQYSHRISEADGTEIYRVSAGSDGEDWQLVESSTLNLAGRPWLLELAPSPSRIDGTNSFVQNLWFALGILLVLLLSVAIRAMLDNRDSLEISRGRYRLLVENQSDFIIKLTVDGEFTYVSPNFCDLMNLSESQFLGRNYNDLLSDENRGVLEGSFAALTSDDPANTHSMRLSINNESRWIEWSSSTVVDDDGNAKFIISVGRDITEQKAMEIQIAHSQKMRAVGELAGGISHDFNNLLQVILANIELLLVKSDRVDKEQRLKNIRSAVNSGIELTARLSTLSKQDSTAEEVLDLNKLLTETAVLIERSLPSSIELKSTLLDETVLVYANRSQLERVLYNLCFNARDAIGERGVISIVLEKLTLEPETYNTHDHLSEGLYARLSVADDGCGMPAKILPRIFEPFFSTKKKDKGTGLGLANSYSIINQCGGIITVDSMPGIGTRFDIYLPLVSNEFSRIS